MITTTTSIRNINCFPDIVDFDANFKINDITTVHVYYTNTDGEEQPELSYTPSPTTDQEFSVVNITDVAFRVTLGVAYDDGVLSIRREIVKDQQTKWPTGGDFPAATHENAADKTIMLIQQIWEKVRRSIGLPYSEDVPIELTMPSLEANRYLGLDANNELEWKSGTIPDTELISADDIPIVDVGSIITATDVEGALQENRIALDAEEASLIAHKGLSGGEHTPITISTSDPTGGSDGDIWLKRDA